MSLNRRILIISSLIMFILSINLSFADSLENNFNISISPETTNSYPTGIIEYNLTIKNKLNQPQTLKFKISGDKSSWITSSLSTLKFKSREEKQFVFYISPGYGSRGGWYYFKLELDSQETHSLSYEKDLSVYVREKAALEIYAFKTLKEEYLPGEEINILIGLNNTGFTDASGATLKINVVKEGEIQNTTIDIPLMTSREEKTITQKIELNKHEAKGDYTIEAFLYDKEILIDSKVGGFSIKSEAVVEKERKTLSNLIIQKNIELTVKNEGNERKIVEIEESFINIPYMYSFSVEPSLKNKNGYEVYVWECDLGPSETCKINYAVKYWVPILMIIIILAIIYLIYLEMQKPGIRKRSVKRMKEHFVHINVKNRSKKVLREVEVTEFIPRVFKVRNFERPEPKVIRKKNGVELRWSIGRLEPKEERIITYTVEPILDVIGKLKLPSARIKAVNEKGKEHVKKSRPIEVS